MSTETTSALDELDGLAQEVERAKARLEELTRERRSAQQKITDTVRELRAYHLEVEAGDREPDPEREQELRDALKRIRKQLTLQETFNPRAGIGEIKPMKFVDPELDGQLAGARERLRKAEAEWDRFRRSRFDDLVVELGVLAADYVERYELVAKHAAKGAREWSELRNRWRPIVEVASFDWADFPRSPFDGVELQQLIPKQITKGEPVRGPRRPIRRRRSSG